jgi:hypothetical protein
MGDTGMHSAGAGRRGTTRFTRRDGRLGLARSDRCLGLSRDDRGLGFTGSHDAPARPADQGTEDG